MPGFPTLGETGPGPQPPPTPTGHLWRSRRTALCPVPTLLWQAAKVWLLMMLHLRSAQERRKALRLQGSATKRMSPHSGLSFHEFTNSSSLDATYLLRVSKSSFIFPLKLPHKPQRGSCRQRHQAGPRDCASGRVWEDAEGVRYLGGTGDPDEDGHVPVPDECQVVPSGDTDVHDKAQRAWPHTELHVGLLPGDRVVSVCQHHGQALWSRVGMGLPVSPGPWHSCAGPSSQRQSCQVC